MNDPVIRVQGLTKEFPNGTQALAGVDLQVSAGETVVLLGANGSGKSTLQKCLTKLVRPTSGTVEVLGTEICTARKREISALRKDVGVVFQKINLVRELSVLTNVIHGSLGRVKSSRNWFAFSARGEQREEAMEALERVGLAHVAERRAEQLSGGQQQRVAIARAQVTAPEIVFADEPTGALDSGTSGQVLDALLDSTVSRGAPLVIVTHDPEVAARCSRLIRLEDGRIVHDSASVGAGV